jgi:hypothetical protein
MTSEKRILAEGLCLVSALPRVLAWRNNTGQAWQGQRVVVPIGAMVCMRPGMVVLKDCAAHLVRARWQWRHSRRRVWVRVRARSEDRRRPAVRSTEEVSSGIRTRRGALRAVQVRRRSRASHGGVAAMKPMHERYAYGGPLRRFESVKPKGRGRSLAPTHAAVREARTIFPTTVNAVDHPRVKRILKGGENSRKIGKRVTKGRYKGFFIFTLTLEERATCPRTCEVFGACYGNGMPYAQRIKPRPDPSSSDVVRAFESAMNDAGFYPRGGIQSDTNGFIRFDAPGDKAGKGNGFYKLKTGRYPVGWFGDWKIGEQHQWFYADPDRGELTESTERAAIKREQAKLKAEAAQARETRQAEVAEDASNKWGRSDGNVEGHRTSSARASPSRASLRVFTARDGTRLLAVPMWSFDMNGAPQLTNLQLIDGDGKKTFLKGGRVEGTFFSIKGDASLIVICEGVATAFSIWQATGLSRRRRVQCVEPGAGREGLRAAPSARNADDRRRRRRDRPDDWAEKGQGRAWENVGRKKAEAAAKAVGCRWICPFSRRDRASRPDGLQRPVPARRRASGRRPGHRRHALGRSRGRGAGCDDHPRSTGCRTKAGARFIPLTSSGNPDGNNVEGVRSTSRTIGCSRAGCGSIS